MTETKSEVENAGRKASVKSTAGKIENSDEEYVKDSSTAKIPRHNPPSVPQYKRILASYV